MECNKCGCKSIRITFDSRGLAEARCADCGSLIKKMKSQELANYYEAKIADLAGSTVVVEQPKPKKPPCRYCTENYAIVRGSMRETRQYIRIDAEYCPICGRKLEESDRAY